MALSLKDILGRGDPTEQEWTEKGVEGFVQSARELLAELDLGEAEIEVIESRFAGPDESVFDAYGESLNGAYVRAAVRIPGQPVIGLSGHYRSLQGLQDPIDAGRLYTSRASINVWAGQEIMVTASRKELYRPLIPDRAEWDIPTDAKARLARGLERLEQKPQLESLDSSTIAVPAAFIDRGPSHEL